MKLLFEHVQKEEKGKWSERQKRKTLGIIGECLK